MEHARVTAAAAAVSGKMSSDPGSAWFGSGEHSASSGLGHNARLIGTAVAAFVSVLGLALFLHLYICHVRRRTRRRLAEAAAAAALPTTAPPPKGGLEAAAIAALPTAVYGDKDEADAAECSICLGAVEEGETVRVLPACGHVFHVPCVDTWLTSSSSCPVCRAGVEPPPPPPAAAGRGGAVRDGEAGGGEGGGGGGELGAGARDHRRVAHEDAEQGEAARAEAAGGRRRGAGLRLGTAAARATTSCK
ncbi:hypothetical protein PR202_gb04713 [Eleusine coracana subsp. coracana]|uniref:RING-type E3 ubiquitin transferase n=1 Tax=Eleusine coracana subsp. coracana TaxID=191504 RepID=A0AAV5E524_ELECO|nr:hypothetical protein PR202_gb04713 [Eleusine coracana subsp. coracana]